jgi:hypothetical protein
MKIRHMLAVGALMACAAPAGAQTVTAKDPQSVAKAMQEAGFQAKLETDRTGDPMIVSAASGSSFWVYFYNCTKNKDCQTIQFQTSYDTDKEKAPSLEKVNEWNVTKRFTAAYLDKDGDPGLSMDVNLDFGGISPALFKDNLTVWTGLMASYEEHIGW